MPLQRKRASYVPGYLWGIWFYPLAGLMLLSGALLLWRDGSAGDLYYRFLIWNIFLAWIPYVCSVVADRLDRWRPQAWGWRILPSLTWLAFLPNAPYIITDFIHLRHAPAEWYRYDAVLIGSFATTGCLLGVVSIQIMQRLVRRHAGQVWGWIFALAVLGLSAVGIYMGRVLRWNSWDIVTRPDDLAGTLLGALKDPSEHPQAIALSLLLAVFLVGGYVVFTIISDRLFEPPPQSSLTAQDRQVYAR